MYKSSQEVRCGVLSPGRIFCKGGLCGQHLREIDQGYLLFSYKNRFDPESPLFGATLESYKIIEDYLFKSVCFGEEGTVLFRNSHFDLFYGDGEPQKLYLILDKSYPDYPVIKIGISKDPQKRLIGLRGGNKKTNSWQNKKSGKDLKLVCVFDGLNGIDEMILHNLFSSKRLLRPDGLQRTEYFELNYDDVEYIVSYASWFGIKPHWFRSDLKQILSVDFKKPSFKEKEDKKVRVFKKKETEDEKRDRLYRQKHLKAFLNRNRPVEKIDKQDYLVSIDRKNGLHVFNGGKYDGQFVNKKSTSGQLDSLEKYNYLKFIRDEGLAKNKRTKNLIKHYLKFKKPK